MPTSPVLPKLVGQRVKRREDPRLIQGRGTYVDDIALVGMQHLVFKRSDVAHGRIVSIDTSAAEAMEGVEAVFTGAQIAEMLAPMPIGTPFPSPEHRAVAVDTVRYAGEPVAVVVAADRYIARDAADAIVVNYDMLPAVVDLELAMSGKPALVHADFPNNLAVVVPPSGTGCNAAGEVDDSAIDAAFAKAEVVISQRMINQRLAPSAMEPRGVVAHFEPGKGTMTIWSSTQNPHILRTFIAALNGLGQDQVRAIAPEVGGGFGAKINIYGEEYVTSAVSKRLGIPVKWMEDRSEAFVATTHGRDILAYVDLAAKRDGTVLGLKLRLIADIGAYNMLLTAAIPTLTMMMANATYNIPAIRATLTEVFTNKTPTDAYRGAGRPEATYFVERAMDMLARELKMDPAELRRKNFIQPDQFPFTTQVGAIYDSGNYENALNVALEGCPVGQAQGRTRCRARARKTRRPRSLDVRRSLRNRAVLVAADGWMGALAGDDRARRTHQRDDGRVAAWSGQRNHVRADACRPVRRAVRAHHDPSWRYGNRQARHRHVRQPVAGGRRSCAADGRRKSEVEDGEIRRGDARSTRRRPGLRERHDLREGSSVLGQVLRDRRVVRLHTGAAARRARAGVERRGVFRAVEQHVSVRMSYLDARDRSQHRRADASQALRRG